MITLEQLRELEDSREIYEIKQLIWNKDTPPEVLDAIARMKIMVEESSYAYIPDNPNTSEETILYMWNNYLKKNGMYPGRDALLMGIVNGKSTPSYILESFVTTSKRSDTFGYINHILRRKDLKKPLLIKIADYLFKKIDSSKRKELLYEFGLLCDNPNTPKWLKAKIRTIIPQETTL
jgi:hypothetical protein